jgi:hypothetical protein
MSWPSKDYAVRDQEIPGLGCFEFLIFARKFPPLLVDMPARRVSEKGY